MLPSSLIFVVTLRGPLTLEQVNDSYVEVSYSDAFHFGNFSDITRVTLHGYEPTNPQPIAFAEGSPAYTKEEIDVDGVPTQPLNEEKKLLAKMDLCIEYCLFIRIFTKENFKDSKVYRNQVDFYKVDKNELENILCLENGRKIWLSLNDSENFLLRSCIQTVELFDGLSYQRIHEGFNKFTFRTNKVNKFKRKVKSIRINSMYVRNIEVRTSIDQKIIQILRSTKDWICVTREKKLNYFRKEWAEFKIQDLYYNHHCSNQISFGSNSVVNISESLQLELWVIYSIKQEGNKVSENNQFQFYSKLNYCKNQIEDTEEDLLTITMVAAAIAVTVVIALATTTFCIIKRNIKKITASTIKDVNPIYGDAVEYYEYYFDTKMTDENAEYNKPQYNEDGEYIRSEIRETNHYHIPDTDDKDDTMDYIS